MSRVLINVSTLLLLLAHPDLFARSSISGRIIDRATGLPVRSAKIVLLESKSETLSDSSGIFYFHQLSRGTYFILFDDRDYVPLEIAVDLKSDTVIDVSVDPLVFHSPEVVVESTKGRDKFGPVPAIVIDGKKIQSENEPTVSDMMAHEPGIALVRDGMWETAVSIRGMSRNNIVMMVDNTRIETANDIATALSLIDPFDIDRIEVIKGANSALGGTGAFGGVVHCFTKTPSYTDALSVGGESTLQYSSVNNSRAEYLAVEGGSPEFRLRTSGEYRKAGDYSTPIGDVPNSQYSDFAVSAFAGMKMFDTQSLNLTYQRFQAENTGIPGGSSFSQTASAKYNLARRELFKAEYSIPSPAEIMPMLVFRVSRQVIERDVEVDQNPALILTPHATHLTNSMQAECSLAPSDGHYITIGVEGWQRSLDSKRERYSGGTITEERPLPLSSFGSVGAYAQDEWSLGATTVTAGGRYDFIRVHNDLTYDTLYEISAQNVRTTPAEQNVLWNANTSWSSSWSANLGANRRLTDLLDGSVLFSSAFRAPSLEERYQYLNNGGSVHVGNPDLLPEKSFSADVGMKCDFTGVSLGADIYCDYLNDLVAEVPGTFEGAPAYVKTNIGTARMYGYELSAALVVVSNLSVTSGLAFVRGEDLKSHSSLPQIQPLSGSVELNYFVARIGTLSARMESTADKNFLAAGEMRDGGYSIFSAKFTSSPIDFGKMVLSAGARNIFNRAYMNFLSTSRGLIRLEPGRDIFASASVNF